MSANDAPLSAILPLRSVSSSFKSKAWEEVEKDAEATAADAITRQTKAAAFQPRFTDTSACNELIRSTAHDYERVCSMTPNLSLPDKCLLERRKLPWPSSDDFPL